MKHNYLNNTPLEEAKKRYFDYIKTTGFAKKTEVVPVMCANGRILAKAVHAAMCSPHYNASAMDGIAVKASDTYGAAEQTPVTLTPDKYTVVDTGDPIPDGADAVIMVEDITEAGENSFMIFSAVHPWQNVRQVGEDICMGDMIAVTGEKITPQLCGAFLAGGVTEVSVVKKPVFGIIPTGDEIVKPTSHPAKGEIIEFNSTIFSSMLSDVHAESIVYDIVPDKKDLLLAAVKKAVSECDAVLILAGSSAGRDDYTSDILSSLGEALIHGVAIKPGKPAVLGAIGSVPVVGLPGYPVSAIVVMEEFVYGLADLWYGKPQKPVEYAEATLGKKLLSSLKYKEYVRVTLGNAGDGLTAVPLPRGAGVITSFTKASGIIEVPQNVEGYEAGEKVTVRLLRPKEEAENALIVTGSHDPAIDEIADILQKNGASFRIISSHVGSMGAISAVSNAQAHLGAVHLLDENGEYNTSYVKKYFPDGGAVLVKGIGRVQGLMVAKGNPLGIKEFSDIARCRYVNRQKGAGTRILCDHLMKKTGLSPEDINGYFHEEFTHTSVAALIAAGNADAGLGIYSAAKMYGLDFIPLCNEEYDFLIAEKYVDDEKVRAFLSVLGSEEFKERLSSLGGYTVK